LFISVYDYEIAIRIRIDIQTTRGYYGNAMRQVYHVPTNTIGGSIEWKGKDTEYALKAFTKLDIRLRVIMRALISKDIYGKLIFIF